MFKTILRYSSMIRLVGFVVLLFSAGLVSAQVGFNNPAPDPSAILDLTATDKGLLIPRMTTAQREAMAVSQTPAPALMVFDVTLKQFCYYDGTKWYTLNTWKQEAGQAVATFPGSVTTTGAVTSGGMVTAPNYALNPNGNGPVPAGGIIMWSGSLASIPTGWALCDGRNNTPDLRDRFVMGSGGRFAPWTGGGTETVTLGMTNIPRHIHTISDPGHTHANGEYKYVLKLNNAGTVAATDGNGATEPNVIEVAEMANRTTGITQTNIAGGNGAGGVDSFDNRPPYLALAYIMKLP
jgi:microcystin-dependent protein